MELLRVDDEVDVESSDLREVSKNFAFVAAFFTGVMMLVSLKGAQMMMSITTMGFISYTAAALSSSDSTDWGTELDVISGTTLMAAVFFLSALVFMI